MRFIKVQLYWLPIQVSSGLLASISIDQHLLRHQVTSSQIHQGHSDTLFACTNVPNKAKADSFEYCEDPYHPLRPSISRAQPPPCGGWGGVIRILRVPQSIRLDIVCFLEQLIDANRMPLTREVPARSHIGQPVAWRSHRVHLDHRYVRAWLEVSIHVTVN